MEGCVHRAYVRQPFSTCAFIFVLGARDPFCQCVHTLDCDVTVHFDFPFSFAYLLVFPVSLQILFSSWALSLFLMSTWGRF